MNTTEQAELIARLRELERKGEIGKGFMLKSGTRCPLCLIAHAVHLVTSPREWIRWSDEPYDEPLTEGILGITNEDYWEIIIANDGRGVARYTARYTPPNTPRGIDLLEAAMREGPSV